MTLGNQDISDFGILVYTFDRLSRIQVVDSIRRAFPGVDVVLPLPDEVKELRVPTRCYDLLIVGPSHSLDRIEHLLEKVRLRCPDTPVIWVGRSFSERALEMAKKMEIEATLSLTQLHLLGEKIRELLLDAELTDC